MHLAPGGISTPEFIGILKIGSLCRPVLLTPDDGAWTDSQASRRLLSFQFLHFLDVQDFLFVCTIPVIVHFLDLQDGLRHIPLIGRIALDFSNHWENFRSD